MKIILGRLPAAVEAAEAGEREAEAAEAAEGETGWPTETQALASKPRETSSRRDRFNKDRFGRTGSEEWVAGGHFRISKKRSALWGSQTKTYEAA